MHPTVYPSDIQYRPGRVQSLNAEQEILLKQCWVSLLSFWGYPLSASHDSVIASAVTFNQVPLSPQLKKKKSKLRPWASFTQALSTSMKPRLASSSTCKYEPIENALDDLRAIYESYTTKHELWEEDEEAVAADLTSLESFVTAATHPIEVLSAESDTEVESDPSKLAATDRSVTVAFQSRELHPFLTDYDAATTHRSFVEFARNDLPDNLLLRYIRARKYVLPDAVQMLMKSLDWRVNSYQVNKLLHDGDAPAYFDGTKPGFIRNFAKEKANIRGQDRNKNPLFIFQSRKHFASDTTLEETEQFALITIEWCRLQLREVHESIDTCSVMFDLTGFSMKNADNAPIKFLTSMFEAHYPECLAIVIVHNAPWIFQTVWNIIKHWLDPVVASKIHFTKGYKDLVKLVEPKYIPDYLGGEDEIGNRYTKPQELDLAPPKAKGLHYRNLKEQRHELMVRYLEATKKWIEASDSVVSSQYLRDRIYLSYDLSDNYLEIDPYIRKTGTYDRDGSLIVRN